MVIRRIGICVGLALLAACGGGGMQAKVKVGDAVPKSQNKVLAAGADQSTVSTLDTRARLYRWRIADLVEQGRPFLVVFGTPQHCSMCVDQLTRVAYMEEKYGERFAFVHVDGYRDSAVWVQWGVKGEPWTFLVDARGRVRSIFPGQTELPLLEREIVQLMKAAA
jgi:hypothetical protein